MTLQLMKTTKIDTEQREVFAERLTERYGQRCKHDGTQPSINDLVRYIIGRGVITDISIKEYLFVQQYADYLTRHGAKTKAVEALCDDLDLSRKTGFYLLKSPKFRSMR